MESDELGFPPGRILARQLSGLEGEDSPGAT